MSRIGKTLLFFFFVFGVASAQQWELDLKEESYAEGGRFAAVKGVADPSGIRFVMNDITLNQPVVVHVIATDPDKPVEVEITSDSWAKPDRRGKTDADGNYLTAFRTQSLAGIQVKGEAGVEFRLSAWVGPEMESETPSTLVSMAEFKDGEAASLEQAPTTVESSENVDEPNSEPAARATSELERQTPEGIPNWAIACLGFSGLCLVGMVGMFVQVRNLKSGANVLILGLLITLVGTQSPARADAPVPEKLNPAETRQAFSSVRSALGGVSGRSQTEGEFNTLTGEAGLEPHLPELGRGTGYLSGNRRRQENLDRMNRARRRANTARNVRSSVRSAASRGAAMVDLALPILDFLNPRVAPLADDHLPAGLPPVPTRSLEGNERHGYEEFRSAERHLIACVQQLERNRYHYQVAMAKDRAFNDFAGVAGSLNPIAGIAAVKAKNDPGYLAGKAGLQKKYDDAFNDLLTEANESLLEMSAVERKHYGDVEWYDRYGLPVYTFLNNKYLRR